MESFNILTNVVGIVLFLMAVTTPINGIPSKCQIDTNGTYAQVTCIFNVDISELPNGFRVDHIRPNNSNNDQDTVFMCQKSQGNLEYKHRPGYELFGTVGKTVTVKILKLSQEHAGKYMCAVIPSDPNEVELCDLPSEDIEISTDAPMRSTDGPTVPPTGSSIEEFPYLPLVIGLPVGGIAVFAIIAACYILDRRRKADNVSLADEMTSQTRLMSGETAQDKAKMTANIASKFQDLSVSYVESHWDTPDLITSYDEMINASSSGDVKLLLNSPYTLLKSDFDPPMDGG